MLEGPSSMGKLPRLESVGRTAATVAFSGATAYTVVQVAQVFAPLPVPWGSVGIYATSLVIAIPFAVAMVALHFLTPPELRFWSGAAALFAGMYAVFATFNYVTQLTVVIPFDSSNTIINQLPHTLFWTVDPLAYILLALSMYFAYRLFWRLGIERWTRALFLANVAVTPLLCVTYFYPVWNTALLFVAAPWGITAPGAMLTLTLYFSSRMRSVGQVVESRSHGLHLVAR